MNDLREQLATYIDAIADPVAEHEVVGSAQTPAPRPRRALAAALAGAAVVLIPAMLIAAFRLLPSDEVATPTTLPQSRVTVAPDTEPIDPQPDVTEPSITAPPSTVITPDVVGLAVAQAESALADLGLGLIVTGQSGDGAVIIEQDPLAGEPMPEDGAIEVVVAVPPDAAPAWSCADGPPPESEPPPPATLPYTVYFQCGGESVEPDVTYGVVRHVPQERETIVAVIEAMLAGPTEGEREAGLVSFFSADTASALDTVSVVGGLAIVDFNEAIYVNNASTSTGSSFFLAELSANVLQLEWIDAVEIRVNGSCHAFWNWLQRDCMVLSRDGQSPDSPFGTCSAETLEPPYIDPEDFGETAHRVATTLASLAARCDLDSLDRMAAIDDTELVWSHLGYGDTPFFNLEHGLVTGEPGRPAALLVEVLSDDYASYVDVDGVLVHVWPAVASPDFQWAELTDSEVATLIERYPVDDVLFSIEGNAWFGISVEIDETGRWRSFSRGLT